MEYSFIVNNTERENIFDIKVTIKENDVIWYEFWYQAIYDGMVLLDLPKLSQEVPDKKIRLDLIAKTKKLIESKMQ